MKEAVMPRMLFACLIFIICGFIPSYGQEIITDRPDFTESPVTVPVGSIQIETGAEYTRDNPASELSCPNALVRMGLFEKLECRIGFTGWTRLKEESRASRFYLNDIAVETKFRFTPSDAAIPIATVDRKSVV